jgi:hypothetical protein
MKINKQLLAAVAVTTVATGTALGISGASAHSGGNEEERAARVSELAERFNLDESEVESYFEEKRTEHEAEREQKRDEHLAGLVEDGTLTQEQADALKAKMEELHEARDALKDQDLTREEMREQMEANREELQSWAEEQGIDLDAIRPEKGEGRRGHHGHGPHGDFESETEDTDSAEES